MVKFRVELVDKGGTTLRTRTVDIPRLYQGNLLDRIRHKVYLAMTKGLAKYRSPEHVFWREWTILQYYKV